MFGLGVIRHRLFETSWGMAQPPHVEHKGSLVTGEYVTVAGNGGVPAWTMKERDQTSRNTAILCFGCGDHCDEVFNYDGACSRDCRQKREQAIVGLGRALRRFARRIEVAELRDVVGDYMSTPDHYWSASEYGEVRDRAHDALDRLAALALEDR